MTCVLLFGLACAMGLWALHQTHRWPTGDGPHYAIMADSLVDHGSFEVKRAYTSGDYVGVFYNAPLNFHINAAYFTEASPRWYSNHSFGLPLLVAPFLMVAAYFHLTPLFALQVGMVAWQALGGVLIYLYSRELVRNRLCAVMAALTMLSSVSYLSHVGNLFPDIPTASILIASLLCLTRLARRPQSVFLYAAVSALAGIAPYLHVKNCLISVTVIALATLTWGQNNRQLRNLICLIVPGLLLFTIYAVKIHEWYGTWVVTSPFSSGLMFQVTPGLSIIASLFDTSRGILPINPAFLLIFAGLPIWWKMHRRSLLVGLAVLMPSMIVQSTYTDWAGGYSPAGGRYMLPLIFCMLPAVAFLFVRLGGFGRVLVSALILAQLRLGVYNARLDPQWSDAESPNELFAELNLPLNLGQQLAAPIFSKDLHITGPSEALVLAGEVSLVVNMLLIGALLARQATPILTATPAPGRQSGTSTRRLGKRDPAWHSRATPADHLRHNGPLASRPD